MSGVIAWQGESRLNHKPIHLVLTGFGDHASKNTKTGEMIQSWILVKDMWPLEALKTGQDEAICGDCKMRGDKMVGRRCYVSVATGMRWVGVNLHKDLYPHMYHTDVGAEMLKGKSLRVGTYGDPAAVPRYVWKGLLQ